MPFPIQIEEKLFASCLAKQSKLKALFDSLPTPESKYQKIINLGRALPSLEEKFKTPENLVEGCQSEVYLHAVSKEGCVSFTVSSDALISNGLAALLIAVYGGELPEVILKCPAYFIEELGLHATLSPGRSNGLSSIYLKMKKEALKLFLIKNKN